jgi:hypothetical protein
VNWGTATTSRCDTFRQSSMSLSVLVGSLVHWFIGSLVHWFIGSLVHWFIGSLVHWFIGSLVHWFIDSLVGWLAQKYRRGSGSCVWPRAYGIAHRNRRRLHLGQWLLRPTRPRYAAKRAITTIGAGTAKQAHSQDCIGCLPYRCHHRYGARQLRHQQSALQLVLTCAISRSVQHLLVG